MFMPPSLRQPRLAFLAAVLASLAGCTGSIDGESTERTTPGPRGSIAGSGDPGSARTVGSGGNGESVTGGGTRPATLPVPVNCSPMPGPAPLRRLTRFEYTNTMRDLLQMDVGQVGADLPAEEQVGGFTNNAAALGVSTLLAESYIAAAEALASRATADLPRLLGCDARVAEDACVRSFIERFGQRAFRRPLARDEVDRWGALYTTARQSWGHPTAVALVVRAFLQSGSFLYRFERTVPPKAGETSARLDGHSVATRLSYLIWGTMPDGALFTAATSGSLDTAAGVAVQARRMLLDPRARAVSREFTSQWLGLDDVRSLSKDRGVYPEYAPEVGPLLAEETQRFVEGVVWDGDGSVRSLLTARQTFRDARLSQFYGEGVISTPGWQRVALDGVRRAGLLTQASLLAAAAKPNDSSPILRGRFVRHQLLCEHLPDPPPDANTTPPVPDRTLTTRERFAKHSSDPSCAGCHMLIDPLGLGFESYDGIGRHRVAENGRKIDASGHLHGTDVPGAFTGAVELGEKLASSAQVRSCAVKMAFRFGYGRSESEADACTIGQLEQALDRSSGNLRDLLLALTQTSAFLTRTTP